MNYQLVDKHAVEHHNEYYELRVEGSERYPQSLFFTTNEENLETVAAEIVAEYSPNAHWTLIPHRKDS